MQALTNHDGPVSGICRLANNHIVSCAMDMTIKISTPGMSRGLRCAEGVLRASPERLTVASSWWCSDAVVAATD